MIKILLLLVSLCTVACTPNLSDMQSTMASYHVVASTQGDATIAVNTNVVAIHGDAGASLTITAPLTPDGQRSAMLSETLDEGGTLAWRVQLREKSGDSWLRLERVTCAVARLELPELPACPLNLAKTVQPSEAIERRIYPRGAQ